MDVLLCSACFRHPGLRHDADRVGTDDDRACPACGTTGGRKLDRQRLVALARSFFVWGTINRCDYGAAPMVQFNEHRQTSISAPSWLEPDLRRLETALRIGFFPYGPRMWMIGEVEPLKALQAPGQRRAVIDRVLAEYPATTLSTTEPFYRIRKAPVVPHDPAEYDSPPTSGTGRLDSPELPMMYGSQDLQVCVHECPIAGEDETYVATLRAATTMRLLDLTHLLNDGISEFESLDMAIHMLFLAGPHSYAICRAIAAAVRNVGFDGVIYPSYFSLLRTGGMPFETSYGLSNRRLHGLEGYERAKIIPNLALFGRPIREGRVTVDGINRLVLYQVEYGLRFGPVGFDQGSWSPEDFSEEPAKDASDTNPS